jgi:hypothetical protein
MLTTQGRMFLTENFLCFACDILGMNKKQIIVAYKDITQIEKTKVLGIFDSGINIQKKDGENLSFCSF